MNGRNSVSNVKIGDLGDSLTKLRLTVSAARDWNQKEFQKKIGVPKLKWHRWENGALVRESVLLHVLETLHRLLKDGPDIDAAKEYVVEIINKARDQLEHRELLELTPRKARDPIRANRFDELLDRWGVSQDRDFSKDVVKTCLRWFESCWRLFKFDDALVALSAASKHSPRDASIKLREAKTYLRLGTGDSYRNWKSAFDLLNEEVESNIDEWPEWQALLGIAWYRHPSSKPLRKLGEAERRLRAAIAALKERSDGKATSRDTLDIAQWEGDLGVVRFVTGQHFREELGDLAQSKKCWKEARELFERSWKTWNSLNRLYEQSVTAKRLANYWQLSATTGVRRSRDAKRRKSIDRDRDDKLRKSIENYRDAKRGFDQLELPHDRALVEYSWGDAERELAQISEGRTQAEHLKNAVRLYQQALTVLEPKHGDDYGNAQWNLGEALRSNPAAKVEDLDRAIAAYKETLRIFHRGYKETEWSDTQLTLSKAYFARWQKKADDFEALRQAVASAKAALTIGDRSCSKFRDYVAWEAELRREYGACRCSKRVPYDKIRASEEEVLPEDPQALRDRLLGQVQATLCSVVERSTKRSQNASFEVRNDLKLLEEQVGSETPMRRWFDTASGGLLVAASRDSLAARRLAGELLALGKLLWPDYDVKSAKRIAEQGW